MATTMRELLGSALTSLRYEACEKRLRIDLDGEPVADTVSGLLVWEPRRLVPTYAVPDSDVTATLESAGRIDDLPDSSLLFPNQPFATHSCTGEMFDVVVGDVRLPSAGFRPDHPDLAGYVSFDFSAFDWLEEDEPVVAHPHDPFKRVDILASSRRVRVEWDGRLLAESTRPLLLFETLLPVRFYLPRADIVADLEPSDTISYCAYKGRASYLSIPGGPADVAWTYPDPLREAEPIRDYVSFFNERVDIVVDGHRRERPVTHWSPVDVEQ
ncbi:DUF427 domain-containing protein [Mycobacterium cookii]|uniref:DUF427 domain-containing protein n=1 Tax=Mycobacterium cookii TaxID=1775 RepID=A0A7I7L027_9MYCO|nr:DUF427 domain-containing protein [Mycobacterium cookii]MCV7330409.1 DUF427 domain-containing protein [Mycobacterium cookii]BBX47404.1 hypothetical protein MCOO_34190 [Mycobacterium cookii]